MWCSQPGLLSHLQPLSLFYTQIHTHSHTHAITQTLTTHTPDDNLMTWQQHTTAHHFCNHSITVLLITCKLISRCPRVTSITLTTTVIKDGTVLEMYVEDDNTIPSSLDRFPPSSETFKPVSVLFHSNLTPQNISDRLI